MSFYETNLNLAHYFLPVFLFTLTLTPSLFRYPLPGSLNLTHAMPTPPISPSPVTLARQAPLPIKYPCHLPLPLAPFSYPNGIPHPYPSGLPLRLFPLPPPVPLPSPSSLPSPSPSPSPLGRLSHACTPPCRQPWRKGAGSGGGRKPRSGRGSCDGLTRAMPGPSKSL